MQKFIKKHSLFLYMLTLLFIGFIFRFYNLTWGSPFYFHPDERNIASSVIQLNFPNQMNPNFFAYGSLPIYITYFSSYLISLFEKSQVNFEQAILVSRFYSAFLSLLIIPSSYFLGKKLVNKKVGVISSFLAFACVGFIQFAHFGTFEMWLTFFGIWIFYFSLNLIQRQKIKDIIIVGVLYGILLSIKISSVPIILIPFFAISINIFKSIRKNFLIKQVMQIIFSSLFKSLSIIFVAAIVLLLTSPYILLDKSSFMSSINYESSVALGTLPVFYTSEFFNTVPVLFQFTRIFPFLINPFLAILFIPSFIYVLFISFKEKKYNYFLLIISFLILFTPQAFLFAKWTRYMIPTLPFIFIIIAIFFSNLLKRKIIGIIFLINIIFLSSYFITAFVHQDSRIQASNFASKNIPNYSNITSETYDMGIVAFNRSEKNITLFNFYDLEQKQNYNYPDLEMLLKETDYIILPSQRIMKTRLLNKSKFPIGNDFYKKLFSKELGYKKIYETPCDVFCKITYIGSPIFSFEETTNVFDRPTIFIFEKIK